MVAERGIKACGGVILDSYLDNTMNPNDAVKQATGDAVVGNRRFFGNPLGWYGISFDFDATQASTCSMELVGDRCWAPCLCNDPPNARFVCGDRVNTGISYCWTLLFQD